MNDLLTPDEMGTAKAAAARIFQAVGTGVSEPFRGDLSARMLIYPTDYTMLTPEQFRAVSAGAAHFGDTTAFVAPYGTLDAGWDGTYDHRLIDLSDYAEYRPSGVLVLEHLLFSPSGQWGVVTTDGGEAVIAGSEAFVEEIKSHLTESDEDAAAFVRDQRAIGQGGGSIKWLKPLIEHIYGPDKAQRLWDSGDVDSSR